MNSHLSIQATPVDYANVPAFGPDHLLARLAEKTGCRSYPLFDPSSVTTSSQSPCHNRTKLRDVLAVSNADLGNPLSEATLNAIQSDGTFIITGQQPGLLLGPLYTVLKAATAISLAKSLSPSVIPAFWIASEDHDLGEVHHFHLNQDRFAIAHPQLNEAGSRPQVGTVLLTEHRDDCIGFVQQTLANQPHIQWVTDALAAADWTNYTTLFASLLKCVFPDDELVLLDPIRLRPLTGEVLARVVEAWPDADAAFNSGRDQLAAAGFSAPLDRLNLFQITGNNRTAIRVTGDMAVTDSDSISRSDLAARIREHPFDYSSGAALRPIVQDGAIPTLATIGGPAELLYLWQIDPIYQALGIQRSSLSPRISATVLDIPTVRRAAKAGLETPTDWLNVQSRLDAQPASTDKDPRLEDAEQFAKQLAEQLSVFRTDANAKWFDKSLGSIEFQVEKLVRRIGDEKQAELGRGRKQLQRVADWIYPRGRMQERLVSVFELLARFGPTFPQALTDSIDPTAITHHVLQVDTNHP